MNFQELNLNKPLLNVLADLGYTQPTPIQAEAFSIIMSGRDTICISQTGTGKTFAYLLPLLRGLTYSEQRHPRILLVVPTRELVLQLVGEVEKLTKYMRVRTVGVYGGANMNMQKVQVYAGVDVLVATPGRLMDLFLTNVLRLKSIQKLVIDEVDEMLNLGFRTQLINMMDVLPQRRQNLLFSATLSEEVEKFIKKYFNHAAKIEIEGSGSPLKNISQSAYNVPNFFTKVNLLEHLLNKHKGLNKVLVFVKDKTQADRLFDEISLRFPDQFGVIHSNKTQPHRFSIVKQFEEGAIRALIATDIIARGLDVEDITHVINFNTPDTPEDYVHRIGRTGRAGKSGESITFINEQEKVFAKEIEKLMGAAIPAEPLPEDIEISDVLLDEEDPILYDKDYLKPASIKDSQGAFHEKKDKNKKVNLGGSYKRQPKGRVAKLRFKKRGKH